MSDGLRFACKGPGCAHERREANHWFIVWVEDMPTIPKMVRFTSAKFTEGLAELLLNLGIGPKWVCGQGCAQKLFERFLNTGTLDEPKRPTSESINAAP